MYIIQNQDGYFLSKSGEWVDGREAKQLFRTTYKDIAANEMFEVNSRDYSLRLKLLECEVTAKGQPIIQDELLPPPLIAIAAQPEQAANLPEIGQASLAITA